MRVPNKLPSTLAIAITSTKCHQMCPLAMNSASADTLVAVLMSLAAAEAFKKS